MDLQGCVGRRLREAREAVGLTQEAMGQRLGLTHVGYGDMERGRVLIRVDHLLEVCRVVGRPISWFVGEMPEGLPAKVISERLGHSSVGITLDLYSHVADELQGRAAEILEEQVRPIRAQLPAG